MQVESAQVIRDPSTGHSRGFGFAPVVISQKMQSPVHRVQGKLSLHGVSALARTSTSVSCISWIIRTVWTSRIISSNCARIFQSC